MFLAPFCGGLLARLRIEALPLRGAKGETGSDSI